VSPVGPVPLEYEALPEFRVKLVPLEALEIQALLDLLAVPVTPVSLDLVAPLALLGLQVSALAPSVVRGL